MRSIRPRVEQSAEQLCTRVGQRRLNQMNRNWIAFAALFGSLGVFAKEPGHSPGQLVAGAGIAVVETESGKLQGFVHHGIYTYRGVPYATAVRFESPQKVAHWEGIQTALTYGYISPMPP